MVDGGAMEPDDLVAVVIATAVMAADWRNRYARAALDMNSCACQHQCMGQAHGVSAETRVGPEAAQQVARVMAGLGTASRVQILARLREGPCSVGELIAAVEMEQSAVSHQLRILRDLNLVVGVRTGRQTIYGLYDPHVAVLMDEALRHIEHLREDGTVVPDLVPISDDQSLTGAL